MAEESPDATYQQLSRLQAWHVRDETCTAGLAELVNAQLANPFARLWGDGTSSSSDGLRDQGEARNALARAVFFTRLGEIRGRSFEQQRYRASGLNLVTAAIVLWNTVYLERVTGHLRERGEVPGEALRACLSPLGWEHINLTGDYVWSPAAWPYRSCPGSSLHAFEHIESILRPAPRDTFITFDPVMAGQFPGEAFCRLAPAQIPPGVGLAKPAHGDAVPGRLERPGDSAGQHIDLVHVQEVQDLGQHDEIEDPVGKLSWHLRDFELQPRDIAVDPSRLVHGNGRHVQPQYPVGTLSQDPGELPYGATDLERPAVVRTGQGVHGGCVLGALVGRGAKIPRIDALRVQRIEALRSWRQAGPVRIAVIDPLHEARRRMNSSSCSMKWRCISSGMTNPSGSSSISEVVCVR